LCEVLKEEAQYLTNKVELNLVILERELDVGRRL